MHAQQAGHTAAFLVPGGRQSMHDRLSMHSRAQHAQQAKHAQQGRPGGPYRSTPDLCRKPAAKRDGCFSGSSMVSRIARFTFSKPPTSSHRTSGTCMASHVIWKAMWPSTLLKTCFHRIAALEKQVRYLHFSVDTLKTSKVFDVSNHRHAFIVCWPLNGPNEVAALLILTWCATTTELPVYLYCTYTENADGSVPHCLCIFIVCCCVSQCKSKIGNDSR